MYKDEIILISSLLLVVILAFVTAPDSKIEHVNEQIKRKQRR